MSVKLVFVTLLISKLIVSQTNIQTPSKEVCPSIEGVGNPILMIGHVHKFITDSLNKENPHTKLDFVYRNESVDSSSGITTYILVFKIDAFSGPEYLGLKFMAGNHSPMVLKSFIRHKNIKTTGIGLGITNLEAQLAVIECGDLKFLFSSYGTDPSADLPYAYYGRNQNSISPNLLNLLSSQGSSTDNIIERDCFFSNYEFRTVMDRNQSDGTPYDDFSCNSSANIPINSIRMFCLDHLVTPIPTSGRTSSGPRSSIRYLQLIFNDRTGDGVIPGQVFNGNSVIDSQIVVFNIDQSHSITFMFEAFNGNMNDIRAFEIVTKDKTGNEIERYGCGRATGNQRVDESNNDGIFTVLTKDFLGFANITPRDNNNNMVSFDVVEYSP